jgi:cardiolipin synthase
MLGYHLRVLIFCVSLLVSLSATVHVLLFKRDPRSAVLWSGICLFVPILGPFIYLIFGVNRLRTQARYLHRRGKWHHGTPIDRRHWPEASFSTKNNPFRSISRLGDSLVSRPVLSGNKVSLLENGEMAYPAMLEAIGKARQTLYLSTYIFDDDSTGEMFVKALVDARNRGVVVRVLVDAVGERYSKKRITRILKAKGVPCARFRPLRWNPTRLHLNLRNHRKLLVADSRVGFIGGMNIRDAQWADSAKSTRPICDMHFRVEGPVVLEMEEVFLGDWFFAAKESLPWRQKGRVTSKGGSACRIIDDGPNEEIERTQTLLLGIAGWAQKSLRIMTPYFIPDQVLIAALTQAVLRGVEVEIILPAKNNLPFVAWASRAYWGEVIQRGMKVYEEPGSFIHSKALVADGVYALVGSSNLDPRSLRLNFECNLEVYDPAFAGLLEKRMLSHRARSRRVTLEKINTESIPLQLRNAVCKLFSPYL